MSEPLGPSASASTTSDGARATPPPRSLLPAPSPLAATLTQARRLWPGRAALASAQVDVLYGRRGMKNPFLALTVRKDLGNCRHALSQVVVAGVMYVSAPVFPGLAAPPPRPIDHPHRASAGQPDRIASPADPELDKIVLTFIPPES
jgi:hypothetical protein